MAFVGALVGMRNSSMDPPGGINLMTHCNMSGHSTTGLRPILMEAQNMRDDITKVI